MHTARRARRDPQGWAFCGNLTGPARRPQVYEEIGFDVSPLIVEADYVETIQQQQQQRTKLFIIPGVSEEVAPHAHLPTHLLTSSLTDRLRASNAEGD